MESVTECPQTHQEMVDWLFAKSDKLIWAMLRRGVAVFGLVVASLLLAGPSAMAATCLAVAVAMFWLVSLCDYMACHWLGTIAQRHEMFRPRDPGIEVIADALATMFEATEKKSQE